MGRRRRWSSSLARRCWSWLLQVPPPDRRLGESVAPRGRQRDPSSARPKLKALADRLERRPEAEADRSSPESSRPRADGPSRFVPLPEVVPARPKARRRRTLASGLEVDRGDPTEAAKALFALADRGRTGRPKLRAALRPGRRVPPGGARPPARPRRGPPAARLRPARRGLGHPVRRPADSAKVTSMHPTYGWVDGDLGPPPRAGRASRPGRRGQKQVRWLPAAEADALHGDWEKPGRSTTEHFRIQTNVPLSEAIAFGRQLEDVPRAVLRAAGRRDRRPTGCRWPSGSRTRRRSASGEPSPHVVYYFATKDEYVDYLAADPGAGHRSRASGSTSPRSRAGRSGSRPTSSATRRASST